MYPSSLQPKKEIGIASTPVAILDQNRSIGGSANLLYFFISDIWKIVAPVAVGPVVGFDFLFTS